MQTREEKGHAHPFTILSAKPYKQLYRGYIIEPNSYGPVRGMEWQWGVQEPDLGDYLHFEDSPEACKDAIDDLLFDLEEEARQAKEYLAEGTHDE